MEKTEKEEKNGILIMRRDARKNKKKKKKTEFSFFQLDTREKSVIGRPQAETFRKSMLLTLKSPK